MLRSKKFIFLMVFLFFFLISHATTANAETRSIEDLKVRFEVTQIEKSKDIQSEVLITNIGLRPIKNISLEMIFPEDIEPKDIEPFDIIERIEPGETVSYEVISVMIENTAPEEEPIPDDTPVSEPNTDEKEGSEDSETPEEDVNSTKPDEDNTVTEEPIDGNANTPSDHESVKTGESNLIGLLLFIMLGSGTALTVLLRKDTKKTISSLMAFVLLASISTTTKVVHADEMAPHELILTEVLQANGQEHIFTAEVSYANTEDSVIPEGSTITRGEWIAKVLSVLDTQYAQVTDEDIDESIEEYRFIDIEGHEYAEDIFNATVLGMIPLEEEEFHPDDLATREFAAVTTVLALGFEGSEMLLCEDSDLIQDVELVEVAVSLGLLPLEENRFNPDRAITENEGNYLLEGMESVLNTLEVDEDYKSVIELKEDVITISDDTEYTLETNKIIFRSEDIDMKLKNGDVILLPNLVPYKIDEVTSDGEYLSATISTPDIEEAISYIDAEGIAQVDMSQFIPAEGITVLDGDSEASLQINTEGSVESEDIIGLAFEKEFDKVTLEGEVTLQIPEISWKADMDLGVGKKRINNVFLKFQKEVKTYVALSCDSEKEFSQQSFLLGKVPVVGIPGIGIYATVYAAYSIEGELKVSIDFTGNSGAQVLNNKLRAIRDSRATYNGLELNANLKFGPKVGGALQVFSTWTIIDFNVFAGISMVGQAVIRDVFEMICLDGKIFLFGEINLLDESILKEWLELGVTFTIWDEDNSPSKRAIHIENLHAVDSCTYNPFTIHGYVAEANMRNKPVSNALIQIKNPNSDKLLYEAYSDENGQYSIEVLKGTYKYIISKQGYIDLISYETFDGTTDEYVESYMMVHEGLPDEKGLASGIIKNSINGEKVEDVTITIRRGRNNTSGTIEKTLTTDEHGTYEVELPLGNYTLELGKEGYRSKLFNIHVTSGRSDNQNTALTPLNSEENSKMRMILTWGENPTDLDSHLIGPDSDEDLFHVSYMNTRHYEEDVLKIELDVDDTTSYGPETISIYDMNESGLYSYYVHDFSNQFSQESKEMSNSGAKVEVFTDDGIYQAFHIPVNQEGVYWHVFDYDPISNRIIPMNDFVDSIPNETNYDETDISMANISKIKP